MIVLLCGAFGSGVSLGLQRTSWWDTGRHGWLSDACRSIAAYTHVYAGSEGWTPTNTSKHVVYGQSIYMLKGYMCMDIQSSQERSNINLYCYLFCTYEYIYTAMAAMIVLSPSHSCHPTMVGCWRCCSPLYFWFIGWNHLNKELAVLKHMSWTSLLDKLG